MTEKYIHCYITRQSVVSYLSLCSHLKVLKTARFLCRRLPFFTRRTRVFFSSPLSCTLKDTVSTETNVLQAVEDWRNIRYDLLCPLWSHFDLLRIGYVKILANEKQNASTLKSFGC